MIRILMCLALCLSPSLGAAQRSPTGPYEDAFNACLANEPPEACEGRAMEACVAAEEGGWTTYGMISCISMENLLWSWAINRETNEMIRRFRAIDADNRRIYGEAYSGGAETLAVNRAAWEAWVEAECALDYARFGAGSHRNVAAGLCGLSLSAARLTRLRSLFDPVSE